MQPAILYEQLKEELNHIFGEIRDLRKNQHLFWEVRTIIHNNQNLRKPSAFYSWMGRMYVGTMTATVRRLVDRRSDTVSFLRLLENVKRNLPLFSRDAYKSRFGHLGLPEGYIDGDYDKLVGAGKSQPDRSKIDADIKTLNERTALLKRFVDERIAHSAKNRTEELPKFQDLDDAIDCLEELLKWYNHLVTGAVVPKMLPVFLDDWKAIFRYAWLNDAAEK